MAWELPACAGMDRRTVEVAYDDEGSRRLLLPA